MNYKIIIMSLITGIIFNSCNSNKTTSNKEELDTVWNEKVQNSFYDLKLGTPTSVEQIVNSLEKHGFYFIKEYSTDESLHFRFHESQYFTFGGLTWEMLDNYNYIKDAIENKYLPTSVQPKDTTIYEKTLYFGRNNVRAAVSCYRYETVTKKIMIGTELSYSQKNIKPANDEL